MTGASPILTASTLAPNLGRLRLEAHALVCARGGRQLFGALSFVAGPGAAIEVRGPNGVGKTTLLRAIAGLMRPTSGKVILQIGAEAPESDATRGQSMHFVGPEPAARPEETVSDSLHHWAVMWGASADAAHRAMERLGLERVAGRAVRRLSSGERKRLGLARVLLQPRPVWLLDEPNTGLDAAGRTLCHKLITEHRAAGGIVILATHDAANLEAAAMIRLSANDPALS
jgi:heme exporter protein A